MALIIVFTAIMDEINIRFTAFMLSLSDERPDLSDFKNNQGN